MRKILFSILTVSCLTIKAQDFSPQTREITIYGSPTEATFYDDIDLYNNVGRTFSMNWERVEESIPQGWTTSNCDPAICHPEGVTSGRFNLPINTSSLNTHFYPNGVAGSGYMKVKLWVTSNPADSVVLTYYGVAGMVGIQELTDSDIQVFPSPALSTLNVMLPNPGEPISFDILNLNGQLVETFRIDQGNISSFDVSKLMPGIYIIRFNLAGTKVITKKFVKQ